MEHNLLSFITYVHLHASAQTRMKIEHYAGIQLPFCVRKKLTLSKKINGLRNKVSDFNL